MTRQVRQRLRFSFLVAIGALLVTWLILAEGSPLADLVGQTFVADAWRVTVVPALLVSAVVSGNPHSPPLALVAAGLCVQWAVVGYLVSWMLPSRRSRSM